VALNLGFFWPLYRGARVLFFGDVALYFVPLLSVQRSALMAEHVSLWNDAILCGTPLVGNPQSWPLYPSSLLLFFMTPWRAVGVIGALHVLWASIGAFAFLRRDGRSTPGALLGAVAWAYGGAVVGRLQFPNLVQAISWLPWLLLAVRGVIEMPRAGRVAALGLAVGCALLAGHPQAAVMAMALAGAWVALRVASVPAAAGRRGVAVVGLAAGAALGLGLACGQLLPAAELLRHSARQALTIDQANRFILPAYAALPNLVAPDFFGNPALPGAPYVARGNFWEPCCYVGLIPLALAILAGVGGWRRGDRDARFWTVVALACFWLAMGRDAGLFAVAYAVVPGLAQFHDPARFLLLGTFAVAMLTARGMDEVVGLTPLRWRFGFAAVVVVVAAANLLAFDATLNPTTLPPPYATHGASVQTSGRVFDAAESPAWAAFVSYRSYADVARPGQAARFIASRAPNLDAIAGDRDACGYDPVRLTGIDRICGQLAVEARRRGARLSPGLLDMLAVDTVVRGGRLPLEEPQPVVRTGSADGAWARASLWPSWVRPRGVDVRRVGEETQGDGRPTSPLAGFGAPPLPTALTVEDVGPGRVRIRLPGRHAAGLVRLADAAYPGWRVAVDGREAPPMVVDGAFRGVFVDASVSSVGWRYDPATWRIGVFISLIAMGILGALLASGSAAAGRRHRC
jgi:hypothetical protein